MSELETRIREILHEEGLRNIPLQNETRKIGEIMETLQIEAFVQLIQQERIKGQLEVIHKIEDVIYTPRLIDVINELKQSLMEKS